MSDLDPLRNPLDPLHNTEEMGRKLFRDIGALARGKPRDAIINAGAMMIANALRQEHPTRRAAEQAFDELFGRIKQVLLDHYDSVSGRKKGVFPYDQVIAPTLLEVSKLKKN